MAKYLGDGLYVGNDLVCSECGCPVYRVQQRYQPGGDTTGHRCPEPVAVCADCGAAMRSTNNDPEED